MPTLRALECLVAVADCGSITEAGRLLHMSQPAVSHQLAALELEVGTPLLHRRPRGVALTPAGSAALAHARSALEAAATAVHSARAVAAGQEGTLRVACAQSLTLSLVAPVIGEWRVTHPRVVVTLQESAVLIEALGLVDSGAADVVLLPAPVPNSFVTTPVAREEIVLSAPPDHELARHRTVRLAQIEGEPLIHFAADNGLSAWLDRSLADAGVRPQTVMRTSITTAAPQLAAAGFGLAVTPVSAVSEGFAGAVRSFSPPWFRQLFAVTRAEPDSLTARFIDDLTVHGVRVSPDVRRELDT